MNNIISISQQQLTATNILSDAIRNFNSAEQYLIKNDLSERCICAKFAFYLTEAIHKSEFKDYCVDVEYNRGYAGKNYYIKRIIDAPITVDLIVHKRGSDLNNQINNLICVEMKKSTDRRGCSSDEERLRNLVSYDFGYCYQTGFMILINMREYRLEIKEKFYLPH